MDLIVKQGWVSTGSSGGLAAIHVPCQPSYSVLYVDHSTIATTQSFSLQSAKESSGPWLNEASTSISTTAGSTRNALRVTGPLGPWVRPYFHTASTGTYNLEFLGVG